MFCTRAPWNVDRGASWFARGMGMLGEYPAYDEGHGIAPVPFDLFAMS